MGKNEDSEKLKTPKYHFAFGKRDHAMTLSYITENNFINVLFKIL
jgi:hypothetical protein